MSPYAEGTSVQVTRSIAELDTMLRRRGAEEFGYMRQQGRAAVAFTLNGRQIRFEIDVPKWENYKWTPAKRLRRSDSDARRYAEEEERRRWRALTLLVKALLVAVEEGVIELSEAFLPYTVLPGGATVHDFLEPQLDDVYRGAELPSLLPGRGPIAIEGPR